MRGRRLRAAVQIIRQVADPAGAGDLADGELLRRFVELQDEAAFAALVGRLGPLVLGVCRRVLVNPADAEDAFQATFLVLVRKARAIVKRQSVGSWLHGVAHRVAVRAKGDAARRRRHEGQARQGPADDGFQELARRDLRLVLDEEVLRLPARYRGPVVLCYLEGRTTEEAAGLLRCPRGTVLSRLARARELLRARLVRRGVCPSGALVATILAGSAAEAAVPAGLAEAALRCAAGAHPATVACLAEGVLRSMYIAKVRTVVALLLTACFLAAGGVMVAQPSPGGEPPDAGKVGPQGPAPQEGKAQAAPAEAAPVWGRAKDGLRLGIVPAGAAPGNNGKVQLSVALENVGKTDLVLNLGIMLGNGRRQLPTAVRLALTDSANKTRMLQLKVGGIAGRVDPFVVPLAAGCRYTLPCVPDEYADVIPAQLGVPLAPGRYRAAAEFVGEGVARDGTNQDVTGLALMKYWTGTVSSGEVPVTVPGPP